MSKVLKTTKSIFWVAAILAALLVIATSFNFFGYQLYVVKSGSMEPKIQTGSVILNKKATSYEVGDVINFAVGPNATVTHRIVKVDTVEGSRAYIVKGDANNTNDSQKVSAQNINGKVMFSVPYLGYLIAFMRTLPGLLLFIVLPAILIIADEAKKIRTESLKVKNRPQMTKLEDELPQKEPI